MGRVLITGMSGVGKSTVVEGIAQRGIVAVDTDYGDWKSADGSWDLEAVGRLLRENDDIVVSGTVENQGMLYDLFDHVVLLTAPPSVLIERVTSRRTNPYGSSAAEREEILEYTHTVEPLLRATATEVIETTQPVATTVDAIVGLLAVPRRFT
ncbi:MULTISPECIES: AAA family ATPase [unclassified Microbacterium]|uniref:AAA family ATPase n=1 Tax=unclassified Microbacterium TaxID=2609290 RepID=UPI00343A50D9